ncbi:sensor histidine kinase [Halarcobacter anaerophilus]|uniref:histidine kinase n=1 Tax=Halarcobacter anaerophilus TaxID=877500 RepID=A0A4Q0Y2U2_9BACT|nr:HAMP domain-containing sensor histidine kinase [Halarcobacter anaerophilus]RXJ64043.1 two-component sensor histidine kinase [Halarcobacter anaerophilus]
MLLIALLYYQNEKKLYFDLAKTKMQNIASNISSQITHSHMNGHGLELSQFLKTDIYKISFYDENRRKIFGNLNDTIDFSKKIIEKEKNFILVNDSTYGHLGIYYIAIEENLFFNRVAKLKNEIIILFLIIYFMVSVLGFFLAKLFLKPIKDERKRLNNFIKDTTHELNTPISAILMSAEEEHLSSKQIKRIKLAAQRISEVYKDLTYIFLEDKRVLSEPKEHNLKELINTQIKYFEALAQKKKISIDTFLEDTFFTIDENDFIRLFNNILSNAIKYNKQKGKIEIELKNHTLTISDSGIGIEKDKINDIFSRYYRATDYSGGFGIGLNIVKNICEKYSIKIVVDSTLKKGTSFILKF